jgi:hypothetical protein
MITEYGLTVTVQKTKSMAFKGRDPVRTKIVITYLLTYSMVQSPSWAADWFAAIQEIPHISRNPKVHYRTHKIVIDNKIIEQVNSFNYLGNMIS